MLFLETCNCVKLITVEGAGPLFVPDVGWMRAVGSGVAGTEDGRAGLVVGVAECG
jgi:hypothetical protein